MMYPESPIYILLSISVVLFGIVFGINYNRKTAEIGLSSLGPLGWFVGVAWFSVCVEFADKLAGLLGCEVGFSTYAFAVFHSVALALLMMSVYAAFKLMLKIGIEDSIQSRLEKFSRENPVGG